MVKLLRVKEIIEQGSAKTIELLAYQYLIKRDWQLGYMEHQVGQMFDVVERESKVEKIQLELHKGSVEIQEILNEVDPDWDTNIIKHKQLDDYLKLVHNIEVKKLSIKEQNNIIKNVIGMNLTLEQLLEKLNKNGN